MRIAESVMLTSQSIRRPRSADIRSANMQKLCYFATLLFGRGSARIRQARLVAPVSFDRGWPIETGTTSLACLAFLPAPPIPNPRQVMRHQSWIWHPGSLVAAPQELHLVDPRPQRLFHRPLLHPGYFFFLRYLRRRSRGSSCFSDLAGEAPFSSGAFFAFPPPLPAFRRAPPLPSELWVPGPAEPPKPSARSVLGFRQGVSIRRLPRAVSAPIRRRRAAAAPAAGHGKPLRVDGAGLGGQRFRSPFRGRCRGFARAGGFAAGLHLSGHRAGPAHPSTTRRQ